MMAAPAVQIKRWTRREYDRMAEAGIFSQEDRVQLIEGDIITMTPQNSPHASAIGKTERTLERLFGTSVWVRVQMPLIVDPDSEPEPDLVVVPGTPDDYRDEHPRSALLVVEVSDTTLALDRDRKRVIYARAGIQEYWIVNLAERCLEVYRDPVASPGQAALYRSSQKLSPSDSLAPLAASGTTVAVADLLP
jgi:Uma2 family endonuclease